MYIYPIQMITFIFNPKQRYNIVFFIINTFHSMVFLHLHTPNNLDLLFHSEWYKKEILGSESIPPARK